jgi:hypothetical protein
LQRGQSVIIGNPTLVDQERSKLMEGQDMFLLIRLVLLLIAAGIHIYRGATGQLQANGRRQRSQLFYLGLGIALFSLLLTLFHVPIAILAVLIGSATALVGLLKPASPQIVTADVSVSGHGVEF